MVGSSYPNGFTNGVTIEGVPVLNVNPGKVFWVSSTIGSDANPGTKKRPFATLDYAIGKCTASKGDIIYLMPAHVETMITGGSVTHDVDGVRVIGLGRGAIRPTISFSTSTGASINVTADSVSMENIIFSNVAGVDSLATAINLTGATDCMIKDCDFRDSSTQTLVWINTTSSASCDRLTLDGLKVRQTTAGAASFVATKAALESLVIQNCDIVGDYSVANISQTSVAATDILIQNNNLDNLNAVDVNIDLVATTDGTIRYNTMRIATDAQGTWYDVDNDCNIYENYCQNKDAEVGFMPGDVSTSS